jgi:hypothetical protein
MVCGKCNEGKEHNQKGLNLLPCIHGEVLCDETSLRDFDLRAGLALRPNPVFIAKNDIQGCQTDRLVGAYVCATCHAV